MQDVKKIETFLRKVDHSFPVPISQKTDIHEYAEKLAEKADVMSREENGEILSAVFGYTENVICDMAYISAAATLPEHQGKGFAKELVKEFIASAKSKGLKAVHLYAVADNLSAVRMYRHLGFQEYYPENEPRPSDLHLIYRIDAEAGTSSD